jgi:protein ImuB
MRRVLCVWLPTFSTDLVKRRWSRRCSADRDERDGERAAIVLTHPVASREVVARRCEAAAQAGISEGLDLAHARSLLPARLQLHVEGHQPARDAAALHGLACWAIRFSPLAAPDPPDGLMIDITGTQRLHRGEGRLIHRIAADLYRRGFRARVAAASTFACAWGVARFRAHDLSRVPPGREREAMEQLPVAAFKIGPDIETGLREIGITHGRHLLHLPRASLAARFDPSLVQRLRLALGEAKEPFEPVRPAPPLRCELLFDGPTDRWESIEAAAREVLEQLAAELARCERGLRRLEVQLLRPRAAPERIRIDLSRPSRAVKHLWALLRARLEGADLGEGIEGVVLTAAHTARLRHEQIGSPALGSNDDRASAAARGELVDALVGRLGANHVVRIEPVESHLPEQAFRERSAMERPSNRERAAITAANRPTALLPRPERASAMMLTPDGPILSLEWREQRWRIAACLGPERIGCEWWRFAPAPRDGPGDASARPGARERAIPPAIGPPPDRDYFAVQIEGGRWVWVYRLAGTGRWFVHGEWS